MHTTIPSRLIDINVRLLCQALGLLDHLDDITYSTAPPGFAPHCVGGHLRHILEFYQCFLNGLDSLRVDYDARRRDEAVERGREPASSVIRSIIRSLETCAALREEAVIWVRMEAAEASNVRDPFMKSSITRELQVLSSHTVHHFALIAITLRMHGVDLDPDFGMAPSTLSYLASKKAEAA